MVGAPAAADQAGPHDVPQNCQAIDGKLYRYYAQSADGTQTELGRGTWSQSGLQLVRTVVLANSEGTLVPINFLSAPIVDLFPSPLVAVETVPAFPSGTNMIFQNAAAPVGWTRYTGYGDRAIRITDTVPSYGGSTGYSGWMAQTVVGSDSPTAAKMFSHSHPVNQSSGSFAAAGFCCGAPTDRIDVGSNTGFAGSSAAHNHTINMNLAYADVLTAQKN